MQRSIPTTYPRAASARLGGNDPLARLRVGFERANPAVIGLFFLTLALGIYLFSDPARSGWYNHFVWQADAFLHGRFTIAYPVTTGPFQNGYFQDVMPLPSVPGTPSYGMLPFPPLPAVLLLPFVALFGLATDSQLFGVVLGAINVGLAWRMASRLTTNRGAAFLATLFFGFGTVAWYAAMLSTTWFLAHSVAATFVLLGMTLAIDGESREELRRVLERIVPTDATAGSRSANPVVATFEESSLFLKWYRRGRRWIEPVQFMAGFVFAIGVLARLPIIFGAPFFVFVGAGGTLFRRALAAGLGAAVPVGLLLLYNLASTGHIFSPAYDWIYHREYLGYMPAGLQINTTYGIEDVRHIPLNLLIMFGWPPTLTPAGTDCGLTLLSRTCPLIQPSPIGMSVMLTSPAYLLIVPALIGNWRRRLVIGSALAVTAIAFLDLMHFSQGWVQFGYRFSTDFAPFALVLVTLAIARLGVGKLSVALVAASIVVNAWGVYWGVTLGW